MSDRATEKQLLDEENKQGQDNSGGGDDVKIGSVKPPFLKPFPQGQERYTLVLDLDETLVHYQELEDGGQFLVRPYAETFLEEMAKYYELIVFTAALQDYTDFILDIIDAKKSISYKFYRQHTQSYGNSYTKDLAAVGRDLSKMIIIDNLAENFALQSDNGILISSWFGDPDDRALYDLTPLLKQIVIKKFPDTRIALKKFRDKMKENIEKGLNDPYLNLTLDDS